MHLKIPHKFTKDEATQRVKQALNESRGQIAGKATIDREEWEGNTLHFGFTAEGQHIEGSVQVKDQEFEIDAKLPFMLRLFESRIEKTIQEQAKHMLG